MRVSVVVPVYNKAEHLEACFASIFGQSFTDFEVIAVDDKSTDDSLSRLHALKDDRLRIVALERNLGHPGATQVGFDLAQGEYIVRCDADDINHPERFARQVAYMDAHPEVGASGCSLQLFGKSTEVWRYPLNDAECQAQVLFTTPFADGASILRRSVLLQNGIGFRSEWPRVGGDWLLMLDLSMVTRLGNLEEPLLHYRRENQNISLKSRSMVARHEVVRSGLQKMGLAGTADQVALHLLSGRTITGPVTAGTIKDLHGWFRILGEVAARRGRCSTAVFQATSQRIWSALFYMCADHGWGPALSHLWIGPDRSFARIYYLLKVRFAALLGKLRS